MLIQGAPGMKDGGAFPLCGMLHIRNKVSALLGFRHMPSRTLVTGLQGESFQATKKLRFSVFRCFLFIFLENNMSRSFWVFEYLIIWRYLLKRTERPWLVGVIFWWNIGFETPTSTVFLHQHGSSKVLHPWCLIWNLEMKPWKRGFLDHFQPLELQLT